MKLGEYQTKQFFIDLKANGISPFNPVFVDIKELSGGKALAYRIYNNSNVTTTGQLLINDAIVIWNSNFITNYSAGSKKMEFEKKFNNHYISDIVKIAPFSTFPSVDSVCVVEIDIETESFSF